MKYKVGDIVKTIKNLEMEGKKVFPTGRIGEVTFIEEGRDRPYKVEFSGNGPCILFGYFSDDMIERIDENLKTDINTTDGSSPIKDSGDRTQFATGAVRDMQGEDKGRCDLLPLDVVSQFTNDKEVKKIFWHIDGFLKTGKTELLIEAVNCFRKYRGWSLAECILEVSILYRDGAEKYQPNNWKLGIPISSYISSGVRHLIKFLDNRQDERHDRSFVWNMFGAIWTMDHKRGTELIDIVFSETGVKVNDDEG